MSSQIPIIIQKFITSISKNPNNIKDYLRQLVRALEMTVFFEEYKSLTPKQHNLVEELVKQLRQIGNIEESRLSRLVVAKPQVLYSEAKNYAKESNEALSYEGFLIYLRRNGFGDTVEGILENFGVEDEDTLKKIYVRATNKESR